MQAYRCDPLRAATGVGGLGREWAVPLTRVAALPLHLCRDLVVLTTHLDEELAAAGGLIAELAARGADVEVLAVTDGDGAPRDASELTSRSELARRRGRQRAAHRRLGVTEVRRHRLGLESGRVADAEADLVAAVSELVGHDSHPGLWCLAPWQHDGHPDHDAVGRVTEVVCHAYGLTLVRYLVATWQWAAPDDLPWPHVRQVALSAAVRRRKHAALGASGISATGGCVGDRELYLI